MTLTNIIQFLLVVIEKSMPVSFLSAVYNGEISLKEADISQRKMEEKIEELRGYRPEEIFDYNERAQRTFPIASEVDKEKSEPKPEESIAGRIKLRKERVAEIEEEENIKNKLFKKYFTTYQGRSDIFKKLRETEGERNEDQIYLIKEVLNRMKKAIENVSENKPVKIEENKKKTNIVEHTLYFNQLEQKGQGLKILTPNQMLCRLPITLAQLKAGNNSEKLKNVRNYCILCTYKKNLQKMFIKV